MSQLLVPLKNTASLNLLVHSIFIVNELKIYNSFLGFRLIIKYIDGARWLCVQLRILPPVNSPYIPIIPRIPTVNENLLQMKTYQTLILLSCFPQTMKNLRPVNSW